MLRRFQTTSEGWLPTSHPCFVDPHSAAVPGMPTVTDLPRLGAMGIVSMSCIIGLARTSHWRRTPRTHGVYSRRMLASSSRSPKWAGCIIGTNAERPDKDPRHCGNERIPVARQCAIQRQDAAIHLPHKRSCDLLWPLALGQTAVAAYHRKAGLSRRTDLTAAFRVQHPSERRRWNLREAQLQTR